MLCFAMLCPYNIIMSIFSHFIKRGECVAGPIHDPNNHSKLNNLGYRQIALNSSGTAECFYAPSRRFKPCLDPWNF